MVEHLKVLISRAPKGPYGRAPKGPLLFNLLIGWGGLWSSPLKGDGGLSLLVEHLKVMAALSVEPAYASLTVEPACASSRWRPYQSST